MISLDDNDFLEDPTFSRGSLLGTINEVKVKYPLRIGVTVGADIFGLFSSGSVIYGVRFDYLSEKLNLLGYYQSPSGDINGLVFHGNNLLTVGGNGSTASLRVINSVPINGELKLISETTPFNNYDVVDSDGTGHLIKNSVSGDIYYIDRYRLLKISPKLVKELRGFPGKVYYGTDGNYYLWDYVYNDCSTPEFVPITGAHYASFSEPVVDNLSDVIVEIWGTSCVASGGIQVELVIADGSLFSLNTYSPSSFIRVHELETLEIVGSGYTGIAYSIFVFNHSIYTLNGAFSSSLYKYNIDTFSEVFHVAIPIGRACGIVGTSTHLIVLNETYTGDGSIHKIDPDTLEIIATTNLGTTSWQKIAIMNDKYAALGGNNAVGVFNLETMTMVDILSVPGPGGVGYSTKDLIVR